MSAIAQALESLTVTPHVRFADCKLSFDQFAETIPVTVLDQQASELSVTDNYGIDCAGNRIKLPTLVSPQFTSPQ